MRQKYNIYNNSLTNAIANNLDPPIKFTIQIVPLEKEKKISINYSPVSPKIPVFHA